MAMYWLLYATPVLSGLAPFRLNVNSRRVGFILVGILLIAAIGSRHEVGCDWPQYATKFYFMEYENFFTSLGTTDPGYGFFNWLFYKVGLNVYWVNTACALIFAIGLLSFCGRQPLPWLTLAAAVPYLVTVVSMGYTRQATALGFLMLAFNAFQDQRMARFLVMVTLATLFHKTAIVFGLLAILLHPRVRVGPLVLALCTVAIVASLTVMNYVDQLSYYVDTQMDSTGGLYRVVLNAAAALAFFAFKKQWKGYSDFRLYQIIAMITLITAPAVVFTPAAVDRMHLYILPFQIGVFARLPLFFNKTMWKLPVYTLILVGYGATLFIWLNYAKNAYCWVPYESTLFAI